VTCVSRTVTKFLDSVSRGQLIVECSVSRLMNFLMYCMLRPGLNRTGNDLQATRNGPSVATVLYTVCVSRRQSIVWKKIFHYCIFVILWPLFCWCVIIKLFNHSISQVFLTVCIYCVRRLQCMCAYIVVRCRIRRFWYGSDCDYVCIHCEYNISLCSSSAPYFEVHNNQCK